MATATDSIGLTQQQRRAIETRDVSVSVSAGAGCGKTFVLTERFLSHLAPEEVAAVQGVSEPSAESALSQLVAITFTDRAAREMRDRIRRACQSRVQHATNQREANYWLAVLRDLHTARISTIHSFCGSLLRGHAVEAGLDPHFRTLDQAESATLLTGVLSDVLRRRLADQDEATLQLCTWFGLERLRTMISDLINERSRIDFAVWRTRTVEEVLGIWADHHERFQVPRNLRRFLDCEPLQRLVDVLRDHRPTHKVMVARQLAVLEIVERLPDSAGPEDDLQSLFDAARVQGGGGKSAWPSEEIYDEVKDQASAVRYAIRDLLNSLKFDPVAAEETAVAGLDLLHLTDEVIQQYAQRKRELAALDFDDLQLTTRDLLLDPQHAALRERIAEGIRVLLVDEFQDTDPLQMELVAALCGDRLQTGKLFFVGDFKQSIYRFRRADPEVFRHLQSITPEAGHVPLTRNFRSQPAILDFVNGLFADKFEDYEPLQPQRPQVSPLPAIEFLWAPAEGEEEDAADLSVDDQRRHEAEWIARRIRSLLDQKAEIVWDAAAAAAGEPAPRAIKAGDIAILFRALSNVSIYEEALRRNGIDYYLVGGHAFYAQQEVFDLLNLLRSVANPADAVSLAGVLRSPFFHLADETLFWLSQHEDGLAGAVRNAWLPDELAREERHLADQAFRTLTELRQQKDRLPITQLIHQALSATGYDALLLAEFLGERKLANLEKLIDQARSFDQAGQFGLDDYVTQLAEFVARRPQEPLAATQPEETDVVRLMTMHQAKGLEFPVVVLPDLERRNSYQSNTAEFDPDLGPLVRLPGQWVTTGWDFYRSAEEEQDAEERTRLFYVATTRAADYLILSSSVADLASPKSDWMKLLAERFDLETGAYLPSAWPNEAKGGSEASARRPQVRVITEPPAMPERQTVRRTSLAKTVEHLEQTLSREVGPPPEGVARDDIAVRAVPANPAARREFSFSRLSGEMVAPSRAADTNSDNESGEDARSLRSHGIDPLGLGTLVHAVFEHVDFAQPEQAVGLVQRHAPVHLPNVELPQLREAAEMIERFLYGPRAGEMRHAVSIHREIEFMLRWPLGGAQAAGNAVFLRGFMDCLYQSADGAWHLVDYKTNRVTMANVEEVAAKYELQMLVYALAAEQTLGVTPQTMALCFLRPGIEYQFRLNEATRAHGIKLLESALAACRKPAQ